MATPDRKREARLPSLARGDARPIRRAVRLLTVAGVLAIPAACIADSWWEWAVALPGAGLLMAGTWLATRPGARRSRAATAARALSLAAAATWLGMDPVIAAGAPEDLVMCFAPVAWVLWIAALCSHLSGLARPGLLRDHRGMEVVLRLQALAAVGVPALLVALSPGWPLVPRLLDPLVVALMSVHLAISCVLAPGMLILVLGEVRRRFDPEGWRNRIRQTLEGFGTISMHPSRPDELAWATGPLQARVWLDQAFVPPLAEIVVPIEGLDRSVRISAAEAELHYGPTVPTADPILDRLMHVEGRASLPILVGRQEPILAALHGHLGSRVEDGHLTLRVKGEDLVRDPLGTVETLHQAVAALAGREVGWHPGAASGVEAMPPAPVDPEQLMQAGEALLGPRLERQGTGGIRVRLALRERSGMSLLDLVAIGAGLVALRGVWDSELPVAFGGVVALVVGFLFYRRNKGGFFARRPAWITLTDSELRAPDRTWAWDQIRYCGIGDGCLRIIDQQHSVWTCSLARPGDPDALWLVDVVRGHVGRTRSGT